MPSRIGILMSVVLAAGIAAPGCGGRPLEAPAGRADARRDGQAERDDQARQDEETRQDELAVRMFSETLKASPTVLTADGQSILVFPKVSYEDRKTSVTWEFYRYENGRFIMIEVLDAAPAPSTE